MTSIVDETAELVERLRALARCDHDDLSVVEEAADLLERLSRRLTDTAMGRTIAEADEKSAYDRLVDSWAEIERLRAELEKARDGMQNALADAIKDAISDLDDHAGDDLPTRRFLAGAIDGLKKALFIAVSASPVPQNGEGG